MKLPVKVLEICVVLSENGFESYIVGGAVRDHILGLEPYDFDIATDAKPDDITDLFTKHGCHVKSEIGVSFKITFVDGIEVATFRKDRYFGLNAKNAEISYADTIGEDLNRRDFTMNSIAYNPFTQEFLDPYNGIFDIEHKLIRFTGNPIDRIYEDPCRIIRACRFTTLHKYMYFTLNTESAIRNSAYMVRDSIAPERIRLEILKAMKHPIPSKFFISMHDMGLLEHIFPSMNSCFDLDGGKYHAEDVFTHLMVAGDSIETDNPLLRLSAYLHDVGKASAVVCDDGKTTFYEHEKIGEKSVALELSNLKFSNDEIHYITKLIRFHMRNIAMHVTPKAIRRLLRAFANDKVEFDDFIKLKIADRHANLKKEDFTDEELNKRIDRVKEIREKGILVCTPRDLALNGFQIMEILDLKPGPEVGGIVNKLIDITLDDPNKNNPWYLTALLKGE